MSFPTLLGFLAGVLLLVGAVALSAQNPLTFFSFSSMLIVLGGTLASAYISYEARYVALAFKELVRLFSQPKAGRAKLPGTVERIVDWGGVL